MTFGERYMREHYEKDTGKSDNVKIYDVLANKKRISWLEAELEKVEKERDGNENLILDYDAKHTTARVLLTNAGIPETINYLSGNPVCGRVLPLSERIMILITQRDETIKQAILEARRILAKLAKHKEITK